MNVAPYRKAIVAAGVAVSEIVRVTADGDLTQTEAIGIAFAVAGAFGVYRVANRPKSAPLELGPFGSTGGPYPE